MAAFIVFEGIDGSGKSTQARALLRRLLRNDYAGLLTHEPGGTPLGEQLRRYLKRKRDISSFAELALFIAARAQLIQKVVRPALDAGVTVLSDRYTASTVAYQGHGRGMDLDLLGRMNEGATGSLAPELTILLDLLPEEALARRQDSGGDTFESAPLDFHRRVRHSYLAQAAQQPAKWLVLDATLPPRALSRQIWEKVRPLL